MNTFNRILSLLSCAALLAIAPVAHAATVTGTVWEGATFYPNNIPASVPPGSFTATTTFTVSGSATNLFNFVSSSNPADVTYSLLGFLQSGGDTAVLANAGMAGDQINNDLFQFTGLTSLTAGTTYTITHDDGIYLYLNGSPVISSPSPTSAASSSFTVATSGIYSFNLIYGEVNGAPGQLNGSLGTIVTPPTPEPNSLMLLGTGVIGAAGMLRRRFARA